MRGFRASVDLLHTVTVAEPDHGLGEGLVVEDGLYPQDALFVPEVFGEVEGGDDRHRLLGAVEPDGVFVSDQDARTSLLVRGVLATLELGVDDEGGLALFRGPDLVEHPEEGELALELGAALGEDERRALDHALAGATHALPRRSGRRVRP